MNKTLIARMRRVGKARRRKAFGVIIIDDPLTRSGVLTDKELAYIDSIYKRREIGSYSQKFQNRDEDILAIAEDFSDLIENAKKLIKYE